MTTKISTKTSGVGGLEVTGDASGILELASNNGTTAVTINASQNVGIGTSSPANKVVISTTGNSNHLALTGAQQNAMQFYNATGGAGFIIGRSLSSDNANDFFIYDYANNATRFRILNNGDLQFNSGYGTEATAYGCRAWVNFNGEGTVAIRSSGNVSSITDNGTGNYTVNFTNAMPDVNYSVPFSAAGSGTVVSDTIGGPYLYSTSSFRINTRGGNNAQADRSIISCAVFR
jgi:cold shock CspA family protein